VGGGPVCSIKRKKKKEPQLGRSKRKGSLGQEEIQAEMYGTPPVKKRGPEKKSTYWGDEGRGYETPLIAKPPRRNNTCAQEKTRNRRGGRESEF